MGYSNKVDQEKISANLGAGVGKSRRLDETTAPDYRHRDVTSPLAMSVSMSEHRSLPGKGRGRDRRLPSAGGK